MLKREPPTGMRSYGVGNIAEPFKIAWKPLAKPWTKEDERKARLRVSLGH